MAQETKKNKSSHYNKTKYLIWLSLIDQYSSISIKKITLILYEMGAFANGRFDGGSGKSNSGLHSVAKLNNATRHFCFFVKLFDLAL